MKRFLYFTSIVLILVFSLTAISAEDFNQTDLSADVLDDESNMQSVNLSDDDDNLILSEGNKNHTEFSSPSNSIYYRGNYHVVLKDKNTSSGLANKTVTFSINSVNYTAQSDSEGISSIQLGLNPGKYSLTVRFDGDDTHEASTFTTSIQILSTVKAGDITKYYKGSTAYTATFFDSFGNVLKNRAVNINVNGKSYSKKTDGRGVVSLPVNLNPGTYRIISTDPITGYKLTTIFTILPTISAGNMQKFIGDGKKFTAKFFKSNGKALAKKYIKFRLKGKTYKVKTNSKGIAKLSLKKLKKGTYKLTCYNRDGLKKAFKIQIYNKRATTKLTTHFYTFYESQSKQIKVHFKTSIGGPSISGKTIKIKINGRTYSKKTGSDGMVSLDLPAISKGLYTVSYSYTGTKYFKPSKSTNYVTVLNETDTNFKVKSTTHFGHGAGTQFKVLLSAGGVPLAKKAVTFRIGANKYVKTTDYNGIASLPIDLAIGKYTVNYSFEGDSYVEPSAGSCDIDVFKRSNSKLSWMSGSSFKDSSQTFKLLLTDSNGNPVKGETVILKIDGVTYTAKTSSGGIATFKSDVALGGYKVSVKFDGNNFYVSSSTSKSIKVKLSTFKKGVNQKTSGVSSKYLKSSSHCKVNTKAIKKLVKKLTRGLKSKEDKAKAIFNYVRDTLSYSYYYDTKYGSSKTLKYKRGNCVDHSHLLVAMFRTAGLKARYVHGTCTFSDERTGHVWTQVLIGNTWVCADAISYRNQLGKIKNWNVKTAKIHAGYRSLPF